MTNDWMKDEALKGIDPYKLEFLQALVFESSNLGREQMKKHASPEEIGKMEKVLAMRSRMGMR